MNGLVLKDSLLIEKRSYKNQPVVTFRDIDAAHQKPDGSARKRFNEHKRFFVEGLDYFVLEKDEAQSRYGIIAPNGLKVFTQTGYLMIVKSFTDELSWAIQRELVNGYFAREKRGLSFMGTPVIPLKDAAKALGCTESALRHTLARNSEGLLGMGDCLLLEGKNLKRYREENNIRKMPGVTALWVVSAAGYEKLRRIFGRLESLPQGD